jgi:spore germination cell wall hydrolase CwlJ-like protein
MKEFLAVCLCGMPLASLGQTHEELAVASVLMGEAWSEGERGMAAVAEVIHQRTVEKRWTPLRVVSSRRGRVHAFSCVNGTTLGRLIEKYRPEPAFPRALTLARTLCREPSALPGLTRKANHFTRADESPAWALGRRPVAVIGRHAFYRLEQY